MEIGFEVQNFHCSGAKPLASAGFFLKNSDTTSPTKQNSSQLPKKPEQTPPSPQFSDVIALSGNHGHLQTVSALFQPEPVSKSDARKSPLKSNLKSRLNRLFSRNNPIKRYFLLRWTPIPQDSGNRSGKRQSEPVLRPEYLVYRASGSPHTLS